jgi:phage terminase small subunit
MDKKKLTAKQKLFIKSYAKSRNATRAAIEAGYSEDTAAEQGCALLIKLKVEIQTEIDKISDRIDVEVDDIVRELNLLAFSDITNFVTIDEGGGVVMKPIDEIPEIARRCIESIQEDRIIKENPDGTKVTVHDKIKYKLHSKTKALEMLAKYKNMLTERFDHTGNIDMNLTIERKVITDKEGKN